MATALSIVTGSGILVFWALAILRGELRQSNEPWPGHGRHEATFLVPDVAVAVALLTSVVLDGGAAVTLRLMSAGGLVFLGLMDLGYLAITWHLRTAAMRLRTCALSLIALGAGLMLGLAGLDG